MNITSLLKSTTQRHREFPITTRKIFLAHAAVSPLPRRVSFAIQDYVQRTASLGQWEYLYTEIEKETRKYAAVLLGADEEEIAFVSSTSMGLSLVASGLSWEKGDNIVVADGDFPTNIYPWLNLGNKGVQTKFIPRYKDGAVTDEDVKNIVDSNTRLVSLSSVNFVTGFKIDIASIGEYLHQRGILFCIDAVQSLGAAPIDIKYVDFLASGAYKWLLGPMGTGIFFVKRKHFKKLHPVLAGWKSVKFNQRYLTYNLDFLDLAQRYEPGSLNILGIVGLHAALELLLEVGIENIAARLARLREIIVSSLWDKGYSVLGPTNRKQSSGIISFTSQKQDIIKLHHDLDASGFVVSLRDNLDGNKCIRISPHFYNTEEEISQLLAKLPSYRH